MNNRKSKISVQLTRISVAAAVVLGVLMGIGQFSVDLYDQRSASREGVQEILDTVDPLASQAAYELDIQSAEELITGLIANSTIHSVVLLDDENQVLAERTRTAERPGLSSLVDWALSDQRHFERKLYHQNYETSVGSIILELDTNRTSRELLYRAVLDLMFGIIRNVLLVILLLYFFRTLVATPLVAISENLEELDLQTDELKLVDFPAGHENDELGLIVQSINDSLTREREISKQLLQAQKLEAIGQLTGGVAHDFNNLLAIIMGNLELLEETVPKEKADSFIRPAIAAAQRGAGLTKNMLSFARRARLSPQIVDINDVVRNTQNWTARVLPATITVETLLHESLWKVRCDLVSIESALVNLILNARDAMPDGGVLKIETANITIEEHGSKSSDIDPGRYVLLAVTDSGHGISKQNLSSIFEPFFTTKGPGAGSGLGLSMVQGFTKQSGGTVRVASEEGKGTTFRLYLPAATDVAEPSPPNARTSAPTQTKRARILVVEDEPELMDVIVTVLTRNGYEVFLATSGDAALDLFDTCRPIDLLLTDIIMPGKLQGPKLVKALRDKQPSLRAVFMSGYASDAIVSEDELRPEDIRLMKPVSSAELIKSVKTALA